MGSVVINDFEVLREARPTPSGSAANDGSGADSGTEAPQPLQPQDLKDALQTLHSQSLRVWAH
ncbi:hypothetical protein [Roseateles amylovorans]|jgi:hypothetical protein|uniref:Uncharacterized protein n=1 Tax=Roseateles amylovorans TaxID=2978473 RepID=A0ABY6B4G5_9BURK|nr:hypothetical protein [Roseateles amylovorans]UXH79162.1 hypothetical protein N4261_04280 [Roseateles amylovorans]